MSDLVKEITVQELHNLIENEEDFQLIDVREEFESEVASIGGILIPLGQIYFNLSEIEKEKKVVIYCRSGKRSADAILLLQEASGFDNLYNLKGGILEWSAEIDNTVSTLL